MKPKLPITITQKEVLGEEKEVLEGSECTKQPQKRASTK